jgi:hypothetical protein
MLWRQTIYFLGSGRSLAKFLARILIVWIFKRAVRRGLVLRVSLTARTIGAEFALKAPRKCSI